MKSACSFKNSIFSGAWRAHGAVRKAVQTGRLPPASDCQCVDCGKTAQHYDHRDYSRPLDVEPVCRSCNRKRGPALWQFPLPNGWADMDDKTQSEHAWELKIRIKRGQSEAGA